MTYSEIREILIKKCGSRCLDDAEDRRAVANVILRLFEKEEKRRCSKCDHLDEVHARDEQKGIDHCLGGPITDCYCTGFEKS